MERMGVLLSSAHPARDARELAVVAEARGYESLWVTEGLGRDAFTHLAAMATATARVRLGTAIIPIFTRTPTLAAMTVASLDELSGGRMCLGLGLGHKGPLENNHGVTFDRPFGRMREYVEIVRGLLAGQEVRFEGTTHRVRGFRLGMTPVRRRVPLYIAGLGLKMARLIGEVADGALLYLITAEYAREAVAQIREGARRAGRDPKAVEIACLLVAHVTPDAQAVALAQRRWLARYGGAMPFYNNLFQGMGFAYEAKLIADAWARGDTDGAAAAVSEAMLREIMVTGTVEGCRQRIAAYRAAGVELPIVWPLPVEPDPIKTMRHTIEALAPA
jgi:probable F420-dependent oxidoreductase